MKLGHLMLIFLLYGTLSVPTAFRLMQFGFKLGEAQLLAILPAFAIALILAGPISRLLRMSPLMIFAGPCPGCRTRPPGWWVIIREKKRLRLACGDCRCELDLWPTPRPPKGAAQSTRPAYRLRWPEFLGIWRRVAP